MKRSHMGVGVLLGVFVLTASVAGCSSGADRGEQGQIGKLSMQLTGQTNGNSYRLQNARFDVTGPTSTVLDSKVDPGAATLDATLSTGSYSIQLEDGWSLERNDGGMFEAVDATLISPNPKNFDILASDTTNVAYQFSTNGVIVNIGVGNLSVSISVVENGASGGGTGSGGTGNMTSCTDGVQDGDEAGVDCGGSCPPCAVGNCSPGTQVGCSGGQACFVVDNNGTGQCFTPGSVPLGGPCMGSAPNECAASGVCVDAGTGPECLAMCDLSALNCPMGQTCDSLGIPGLGVCL